MIRYALRAIAIILLLSPFSVISAPKIGGISLRQGSSIVKYANSSARLSWRIDNPDSEQQTVTLRIKPETGTSPAIYSREITISPKTSLEGETDVVISDSEQYLVELIFNGVRIAKDVIICKPASGRRLNAAIFDDSTDIHGLSEIQKHKQLSTSIGFTSFPVNTIPAHWSALKIYHAIILVNPNLHTCTTPQLIALTDYVSQGGLLLIAEPKAYSSITGTILEDLLPVTPMDIFTFDSLNPAAKALNIKNWKQPPEHDKDGFPANTPRQTFINLIPKPNSLVHLTQEARPAVVISRHGRGTVMALAFNPFELGWAQNAFIPPLWNMVIHCSSFTPHTMSAYAPDRANTTLQQLQGYSIPPVSKILMILLVYMLGALLILGIFFHFKRHASGWLCLCAFAIITTCAVMFMSGGISSSKADCALATITTTPWNGDFGAVDAHSLLISSKDMQPGFTVDANKVFITPQPPKSVMSHINPLPSAPLWMVTDGSATRFEKLVLQQNRPRTFQWFSTMEHYGANPSTKPTATYTNTGIKLDDWILPSPLSNSSRALLAMNGGIRTLEIHGNTVTDPQKNAQIEADTVFTSAISYAAAQKFTHPCLLLFNQGKDITPKQLKANTGNDSFTSYTYGITVIPVAISKEQKPAVIGNELISWFIPDKSLLKTYFLNGKWNNVLVHGSNSINYLLDFFILPEAFVQNPKSIDIDLDIIMTSDTTFEASLQTQDGAIITPESRNGNSFHFDISGRNVIAPTTCSFRLNLSSTTKSSNSQNTAIATRTLYWKINNISARVSY